MSVKRLDVEIVERGLAKSRERAKEYIQKGSVLVNGKTVTKPSFAVNCDDDVKVIGETLKYVGRGGLKMEAAVNTFELNLNGMTCVDLGASTGGFTDCMLKNGAVKVYAIDVGHGQLDDKLVCDERVVNLEGINVKDVTSETVGEKIDLVTADLSFISCRYAFDAASRLLEDGGIAVVLIKPQFEAGRSNIAKGGIVKDKKAHVSVLADVCEYIGVCGFSIINLIPSPIHGGDGNIEYLVCTVKRNSFTNYNVDYKAVIDTAFSK